MTIKEIIDQTNDEVNNKRKEQREALIRSRAAIKIEITNRLSVNIPEGIKQAVLKGKDYIEIYDDRNCPGVVVEVIAEIFPELFATHRNDNSNIVYKWCY